MVKKYNEDYSLPENRDQFVDITKGEVVDKEDLPVVEVIKAVAKRIGCDISDPLEGHKKCIGRGYIGFDFKTKAPIPCTCLFRNNSDPDKAYRNFVAGNAYGGWNRKKRREMKKIMKQKKKRMGLDGRNKKPGMGGEISASNSTGNDSSLRSEGKIHQDSK